MKNLILTVACIFALSGCAVSVGETLFPGDAIISNDDGGNSPGADGGGDDAARFFPSQLIDLKVL